MPAPQDPRNRDKADGILEAVAKGGRIELDTLHDLLQLLQERSDYKHHVTIEIVTGALLKTIDNEDDAQESIRRLRAAPVKHEVEQTVWVELDESLVKAVDAYLDTDWKDGRDPSKFGALNAIAYVGERVAAIRALKRKKSA